MQRDIFKMRKEIENLPESKLFQNIDSLKSTIDVFQGNSKEIIDLYNRINLSPMNYFPNNRHRDSYSLEARNYIHEMKRLLHNYVSSVYTLIDNTRSFYNRYSKEWQKFPTQL